MHRFQGKVVIVTGAASGIGAATARRFSKEGAAVVLVGRTRERLDTLAADLPSERTLVYAADVGDAGEVSAFVAAAVDKFGGLDVLVNNAGVFAGGDPATISDDDWHEVMRIDVDGVFYGCRAAIPHLLKTKGSIVNTASVSGLGGDWGASPYNAAKGAVVNYTKALALDLGPKGIRVNSVCPSLTRTDMTGELMQKEEVIGLFMSRIALGRICEADEVAAVIAFLASPDASFVTGANIPVDGGLSASNGQPNFSSKE